MFKFKSVVRIERQLSFNLNHSIKTPLPSPLPPPLPPLSLSNYAKLKLSGCQVCRF